MKHFLHKLMLLAVCLMASIYANAYDVEVDGIYYNLLSMKDKTVEVTEGDNKYTGDVVIPGKVTIKSEEFAVIGIGKDAFSSSKHLTSVAIPEGVTSIGFGAFQNCSGLTSVTIPESVTSIGEYAFWYCSGLTSVTIPESVTTINKYAFRNCSSLTSVTIPEGVTSIGEYAFQNCSGLTSVTIPESVTSIGEYAFQNCSGLTSVTIPEGVTSIDSHAFENCSGLTSVTIPESVARISVYAFQNCSGLTSVTIPEGVTYIGTDAFKGCKLSEIILKKPDSIYKYSSINCSKLCTIYVPAGAKALYEAAEGWADCYDIVELPLDDSKLQEEIKNAEVLLATLKEGASYTIDLSNAIETAKNITAQKDVKNAVQTLKDAEEDAITRSQYPDIADHYYLKNVGTGMFLEGGNDWGTQASLGHGIDFILAGAKGKYSLDSQISNGGNNHYLGSNGYVDGGSTTFVFTEAGDGYTISSGDAVLTASEGSTVVSFAAENGAYSQWKLLTAEQLSEELQNATEENPMDVTWAIQDASFGRNNTRFNTAWGEADLPGKGGDAQNMNAEKWGGNTQEFTTQQTITLPNGWYKLTCDGFYRYNNTTDNTNQVAIDSHADGTEEINSYLFANDEMKALKSIADTEANEALGGKLPFSQTEASTAFNAGLYQNYLFVEVTDGAMKLGVKKISHPGCDWTVFDNFELTYYGTEKPKEATLKDQAFKLTYTVDGEEYYTEDVVYDTALEAIDEPTKEGYTFSGWSELPATMPAEDVTIAGTFSINSYTLTYTVDGEEYQTAEVEYGTALEAIDEPTKEGYTFSGWSELPETMPAENVTITGTFTVNSYTLTYTVDGEEYQTAEVEYGTALVAIDEPTKEGYTFSGWSELPATMPAEDVTIVGTFSINSYKLIYTVDGEEFYTADVEYGTALEAIDEPTKEGYTFSGWSELPETMPAEDVTITGTFTIVDAINSVSVAKEAKVYSINGNRLQKAQRGVNIIRMSDGTTKKVIKK